MLTLWLWPRPSRRDKCNARRGYYRRAFPLSTAANPFQEVVDMTNTGYQSRSRHTSRKSGVNPPFAEIAHSTRPPFLDLSPLERKEWGWAQVRAQKLSMAQAAFLLHVIDRALTPDGCFQSINEMALDVGAKADTLYKASNRVTALGLVRRWRARAEDPFTYWPTGCPLPDNRVGQGADKLGEGVGQMSDKSDGYPVFGVPPYPENGVSGYPENGVLTPKGKEKGKEKGGLSDPAPEALTSHGPDRSATLTGALVRPDDFIDSLLDQDGKDSAPAILQDSKKNQTAPAGPSAAVLGAQQPASAPESSDGLPPGFLLPSQRGGKFLDLSCEEDTGDDDVDCDINGLWGVAYGNAE